MQAGNLLRFSLSPGHSTRSKQLRASHVMHVTHAVAFEVEVAGKCDNIYQGWTFLGKCLQARSSSTPVSYWWCELYLCTCVASRFACLCTFLLVYLCFCESLYFCSHHPLLSNPSATAVFCILSCILYIFCTFAAFAQDTRLPPPLSTIRQLRIARLTCSPLNKLLLSIVPCFYHLQQTKCTTIQSPAALMIMAAI